MQEMNYGCGATVHPTELSKAPRFFVRRRWRRLRNTIFPHRAGAIAVDPSRQCQASPNAKRKPLVDPSFVSEIRGYIPSVDVVTKVFCSMSLNQLIFPERFRKHFGC